MWYDKRRQQHRAYWGKPEQLTCDEDAACECGFRLLNRFRLQGSSSRGQGPVAVLSTRSSRVTAFAPELEDDRFSDRKT